MSNEKQLTLTAKIVAKKGKEQQLAEELNGLLAPTRAEEGCISYDLHTSWDEAEQGTFLFYETWANEKVWEAHMETPHIQKLVGLLDELVEGDIEINKWIVSK